MRAKLNIRFQKHGSKKKWIQNTNRIEFLQKYWSLEQPRKAWIRTKNIRLHNTGNFHTHNIYQNTTNKIQTTKKRIWTIQLLLQNRKFENFKPLVLEITFFIDSGAEKNILIFHMEWITGFTSKTITFQNIKQINYSTRIKFNKLRKNSIIPCFDPNNGTEQAFKQTL